MRVEDVDVARRTGYGQGERGVVEEVDGAGVACFVSAIHYDDEGRICCRVHTVVVVTVHDCCVRSYGHDYRVDYLTIIIGCPVPVLGVRIPVLAALQHYFLEREDVERFA